MEIIIVTGLSGAGKSRAINAFEDIGYFCVDNLPPKLINKFVNLCDNSSDGINKVAIVADARGGSFFSSIFDALNELEQEGHSYKILFLDCKDEIIVRRFKETRRRHHLSGRFGGSLELCVKEERNRMLALREKADYIIDTTSLSPAKLRERIDSIVLSKNTDALRIHCVSFGFKYGVPIEADIMFDVRCLKNPFYVDELRDKTGLDKDVYDYVMEDEPSKGMISRILSLIDYSIPLYCAEGKSQLVIAIGCTGGHHRSVAMTKTLADHLAENGMNVSEEHRDITKGSR